MACPQKDPVKGLQCNRSMHTSQLHRHKDPNGLVLAEWTGPNDVDLWDPNNKRFFTFTRSNSDEFVCSETAEVRPAYKDPVERAYSEPIDEWDLLPDATPEDYIRLNAGKAG